MVLHGFVRAHQQMADFLADGPRGVYFSHGIY